MGKIRMTPLVRGRAMFLALALAACGSGEVGFSGPNGQQPGGGGGGSDSTAGLTLTVTPNPVRISVGAALQFTSRLSDAVGNVVAGTVSWGSASTSIASVDGSGTVTGVGAGTTNITASEHGLQTSATVEVDPVPVASVAVTPRTDTLQVGTQVTLSAVTKDAVGNTLTGRQITWSSRSAAASVNSSGTVTALSVGVDSIVATSEGASGASVITVVNVPVSSVDVTPNPDTVPLGGTGQLTATPRDSAGNPLSGRTINWSSGNSSVASVSGAGVVNGVAAGTTTISATSGGKTGSATVVVAPVPVASVKVTPKTPSVQVGNTVQLTATTRDSKGNTLTGRVVTWGSGNTAAATVDGNGLVSGVAAGSSVITATSEGINGTATATVTSAAATLVRVIMTPDTATINTGTTKQFTTTGKYSDSSTASLTPAYTATGGSVSASGVYTAGSSAGTFRVIATSTGLADTSTVTVVKPPVAQVIVAPGIDTVGTGTLYQLSATTKDAGGNVLTGRVVTWGSSSPLVATVSGSGGVTALAPGSTTITATSEGIPGTATTVVKVVLAASVSIAPTGATVIQGSTLPLAATVRDIGGNILTGHTVTWSSLNTGLATVDATGVVTGKSVGTATIKAAVDTTSATTTVRVDTSSAATPWLLEDFSSYTSTSNLLADPRGIYSLAEDEDPSQIVLDNSVGYGSSTRSMRFDFPDRTGEGGSGTSGRCTDFTVGRNINLPSPVTEIWVEVEAKFSSGFTSVAPSSWGCTSAPAYKFVFARTPTGRFNLVLGIFGGDYTFGWPANQEPSDDPMPFTPFDSQWHVYRMHFKVSTPSSAANGACELWVDGVLVKSFTGIVESNPDIYGLAIGRNMNQGPGAAESEWWGRIAVWNTNPGW